MAQLFQKARGNSHAYHHRSEFYKHFSMGIAENSDLGFYEFEKGYPLKEVSPAELDNFGIFMKQEGFHPSLRQEEDQIILNVNWTNMNTSIQRIKIMEEKKPAVAMNV